jgi:hypothetical protein
MNPADWVALGCAAALIFWALLREPYRPKRGQIEAHWEAGCELCGQSANARAVAVPGVAMEAIQVVADAWSNDHGYGRCDTVGSIDQRKQRRG